MPASDSVPGQAGVPAGRLMRVKPQLPPVLVVSEPAGSADASGFWQDEISSLSMVTVHSRSIGDITCPGITASGER